MSGEAEGTAVVAAAAAEGGDGKEDSAAAGEGKQDEAAMLDKDEIVGRYQQMMAECRAMVEKIQELELEIDEHQVVISTLRPLDGDRKAFRMVGDVLVERTVSEVLPVVTENQQAIRQLVATLQGQLKTKDAETTAWKKRYNIRTQAEVDAMRRQQAQQAAEDGKAG